MCDQDGLEKLEEFKKSRVTLRPKEAAEVLGVSQRTLIRWRQKAEGPPFISMGNYATVLYPIKKLEAWMEEREN